MVPLSGFFLSFRWAPRSISYIGDSARELNKQKQLPNRQRLCVKGKGLCQLLICFARLQNRITKCRGTTNKQTTCPFYIDIWLLRMIAGQIPRGPLAAMAQTTDLQWVGLGFGFSVPRARIVPLIKAETNFQAQNTAAICFVSKLIFHIWSANLVTWDTLQLQKNKFIFNSSYLIALQLVGLVCGEISTS